MPPKTVNPKRIAMVAYTFYASDPRVRRHVAALTGAGYLVDVLALAHPSRGREQNEGPVRFFFPRSRDYARQGKFQVFADYLAFMLVSALILLRNHCFDERYAMVHINNMPNFLVFSALPLRLLGTPFLLDVHDTMPEIYQAKFGVGPRHWVIRALFWEEWLGLKLAPHVLTTEHTKWDRLRENGLRENKSTVTLNLPDASLFPAPEIPHDAPKEGPFRLIYHGTLAHRLGVDVGIRAMPRIREAIPEVRFDIIGDGEQRGELLELARELGVDDVVRFSDGFVATEEIPNLVAGADLAIIPSRNTVGTKLMLPTKLLEYVRFGIPAVTVATPTITRYFDETQVHFVASEDPEALAGKVIALHQDPAARRASAMAARRFFEQYTFESEREKYLTVVADLAGLPGC